MTFHKSHIISINTFYCENCQYDTMQEKWKPNKSNQDTWVSTFLEKTL